MRIYTVSREWTKDGERLKVFECEGKQTKKGMKADGMHSAFSFRTFLNPSDFSDTREGAITQFIQDRESGIEGMYLKIEKYRREIEEAKRL